MRVDEPFEDLFLILDYNMFHVRRLDGFDSISESSPERMRIHSLSEGLPVSNPCDDQSETFLKLLSACFR
jgi:hypothetical protein